MNSHIGICKCSVAVIHDGMPNSNSKVLSPNAIQSGLPLEVLESMYNGLKCCGR